MKRKESFAKSVSELMRSKRLGRNSKFCQMVDVFAKFQSRHTTMRWKCTSLLRHPNNILHVEFVIDIRFVCLSDTPRASTRQNRVIVSIAVGRLLFRRLQSYYIFILCDFQSVFVQRTHDFPSLFLACTQIQCSIHADCTIYLLLEYIYIFMRTIDVQTWSQRRNSFCSMHLYCIYFCKL